jgi:hypothetical protein
MFSEAFMWTSSTHALFALLCIRLGCLFSGGADYMHLLAGSILSIHSTLHSTLQWI